MEFNTYRSPFSYRYGSMEMRKIWSEEHKRRLWRKIWLSLAKIQSEFNLVDSDQVADLEKQVEALDFARVREIEAQIHHDLMAELKVYAEQCPHGGKILHLGATSMDIKDNATAIQIRLSLDLVLKLLGELLLSLAKVIEQWADTPIIAMTHLQPAEPSTLGYRLSLFAQDLVEDFEEITRVYQGVKGKGFSGAVGTGASFAELLGKDNLALFQQRLSEILDLPAYPISSQTYPRKQDFRVMNALAGLGATVYRFTFEIRILQNPMIGELSEPFAEDQIGSSTMPFKRNPVIAEKLNSLARVLAQYQQLSWSNAANSLLERTLDDSANRRSMLPEAFLICDELIRGATHLVQGLVVDTTAIERNLQAFGSFAATEKLLMALVKAGADRQEMHHRLRGHSLLAWEAIRGQEPNPLHELIAADEEIAQFLPEKRIRELLIYNDYVGNAPERARLMVDTIRKKFDSKRSKS